VNGVVLVTGAAGFAGSHVVQALAGEADVVGWTHHAVPPDEILRLATWVRVDLLNPSDVREAIGRLRPAAVIHCAGAPNVGRSWRDTMTPFSVNVLATHHLFDALRCAGTRCRVVVPGSATVYAPSRSVLTEESPIGPPNPYALSKFAQEQLALRAAREDGVDVIVTRSFNHTGPRQSAAFAAPNMARQVAMIEAGMAAPLISVGNLDAQRDFTDVRDMARAYIALLQSGTPSTLYNVASGSARSMRAVLDALIARARVKVTVETDPALMRPTDTPIIVGDASKLRDATGWRPEIPFDRTLDDLLNYWRSVTVA
jgi:GDP-4-dehydro-6-deoxy-D-mannose reductase